MFVLQSEPDPWYADPIWAFLGNVAAILSLLALVIAVAELVRRGEAMRPQVWGVEVVGTRTNRSSERFHVLDFYNAGSSNANVLVAMLFESWVDLEQEYRVPAVMMPGETRQLFVSARRIDEAWILVAWVSHHSTKWVHVEWLPLTAHGIAFHEWQRARDRTPLVHRWQRPFLGRSAHRVGPGGRSALSIRSNRTHLLNEVLTGLPMGHNAMVSGQMIRELPYVPWHP